MGDGRLLIPNIWYCDIAKIRCNSRPPRDCGGGWGECTNTSK